ncbi:MAG: SdrD B-like domain-containing protein [Saprospiraceae bacterium]
MKHTTTFFYVALILIINLLTNELLAQCPPGSIYVYNQNQVNAFLANYPNCEEINGSLIISFQTSPEITDLTPFRNIKRVNGDLQAAELNSLTSLYGLHNVEYVQKSLRLNQIPGLTAITEMHSLIEVGEFILILNMANVIRIDSFNALTRIGKSLNITRSPKLQIVSSFEKLESVNSGISFQLDPELLRIPTFTSLKHVGLSISIIDAPKFKGGNIFPALTGSISSLELNLNTAGTVSFSGFHHLDSIRSNMIINLPKGLVDNAFQNLTYIGGNAEITTDNTYFSFATRLRHVGGYLSIKDCNYLKSLGSFDENLMVDDYIALWNNNALGICNVPFICRSREAGIDLSIVGGLSSCSSILAIDCSYEGVSGIFYFDQNQDGIWNNNETGVPNMKVEVPQTGAEFVSNMEGNYFFNAVDGNSYTVNAIVPAGWQLTSQPSYTISFEDNNPQNRFYHFGVYPTKDTSAIDLQVFGSEYRCSGYGTLDVKVENQGTDAADGALTIDFDEELLFAFSIPAPDTVDQLNHTVSWNVGSLSPAEVYKIQAYFKNPPSLSNADSIYFTIDAAVGDSVYHQQYARLFSCAAIETDRKYVSPDDGTTDNIISKDEELIYTVEIQNNTIEEVRDAIIYDTLSPFLDMSTFRILDQSHPVRIEMEGRAIKFIFDEVFLLDTAFSSNLSHAFVTYGVHPLIDVAKGSVIENTGYIYFDQVPGVITNTVINTIEGVNGVYDLADHKRALIYPNPGTGDFVVYLQGFNASHHLIIQIANLQGQVIEEIPFEDNIADKLSIHKNLNPGMYILAVIDLKDHSRSIAKFLVH